MPDLNELILYRKAINSKLDKDYAAYKRMRLWRGVALTRSLSEEEIDLLLCLEKKEREIPRRLTVHDVSTLTVIVLFLTNESYLKQFK